MAPTSDPIAAVSQRLASFVARQRAETASMGPEAALLVTSGAAAIDGGKRLRARFCVAGWHAVAETDGVRRETPDAVVSAAAALEVFHAAALVHDDLIDNSDTRRGRASAHRGFEAVHREAQWVGDPETFGRSTAVLLGDLLVAWSDDLLEEGLADAAPAVAAATRGQYALMRRDVTIGQFLDLAEESAYRMQPDDQHVDRALRVASLKSARYSIQQPLLIGGELAGAAPGQREALAAFGHPIGMAFQLRDDVLGVFGDERVTGKPSGDDLREGKRTVLVAFTRQSLPPGARRLLDELIGDPTLDASQIASLQSTIRDTGALARVETLISAYAREADRALAGAPLGHAAVGELRDLATAATARSA